MRLAKRTTLNVCCFPQHIFPCLGMICPIRINPAAFRDITLEALERTPIAVRPWSQTTFARLPVFGHQEMHFESIKVPSLAGDLPAIWLLLIQLGPWTPVIVTHSYRKAVNNLYGVGVEIFPSLSEQFAERPGQLFETRPSAVQTTAAEQVWDVSRRTQQSTRRCIVPATA
jgi:hypothetical protein